MSPELSDKEADALFSQLSGALVDNDPVKLDELLKTEDVKVDEPVIEDDKDDTEQPDLIEDDKEADDPADKQDDDTQDPPEDKKPEDDSDKKTDNQPDELADLRAQLDKLKQDKEKADKDLHHLRSQAGRMKAMSRNMQKYDEKLEEIQKQLTSPSNRPSANVLEKVKTKLKNIEDIDPELASLLEVTLGEALDGVATSNLNREKETIELLREREVAAYEADEAQRLLAMYPNAVEVFNSQAWKEWKKDQPKGIVALAESSNADEVSTAFQLYQQAMITKYPDLQKQPEKPAPSQPDPKALEIEKERERKKANSASVASPKAQGKVGLPDDPDALFNKFYEQIRKST